MFEELDPMERLTSLRLLEFDYTPELIEQDLKLRSDLINDMMDFLDNFFKQCEEKVKQECQGNPKKEAVYWRSFLNVSLQYYRKELLERYKAEQEIHELKLEAHRLYHQPLN